MKLQDLQQKYKELGEEIERLESEKTWPSDGDTYYVSTRQYYVSCAVWGGDKDNDAMHKLTGNVFRTYEHAKTRIDVNRRIIKLNNGWVADWSDDTQLKSCLYYSHPREKWCVDRYVGAQIQGAVYVPPLTAGTLLKEFTTEQLKLWAFGDL